MAIVVIDPGHGGAAEVGGSSPNNARGPSGLLEKSVTLDLARRVRTLLASANIDARLTRDDDRNLGLEARARLARQAKADAFVSIHLNGFNGVAQGTETYHHGGGSADSKALAAVVQAATVKATGLKDRGVKSATFGVLRPDHHAPTTAACLVEISFMDTAAEEGRLKTDSYKDQVARALARAITGWLVTDQRLSGDPERHLAAPQAFGPAKGLPEDGYEAVHGLEMLAEPPNAPLRRGNHDGVASVTADGGEPIDAEASLEVAFLADPTDASMSSAAGVEDLEGMLSGWRKARLTADTDDAVRPEIIIGRDESLDAVFLEVLAQRRAGVGIIWTSGRDYEGREGSWSGTGFLVAPNLLLTNHHVLNSPEVAEAAELAFDYELSLKALISGRRTDPVAGRRYRLRPDQLFITSPLSGGLDYSFVWIEDVQAPKGAVIRMERAAFSIKPEERAFLVHHPAGRPKRVSFEDSDVVTARPDGAVIHYTSDTEPGSSGAPVFDRTGRLIALHHASRRNVEQIQTSDGLTPTYVNEGIKIAAIALDLETRRTGATAAMIDIILGEIYGSDTLTGFFGAAGREVAQGQPGVEKVVDLYNATAQDLDVGFWNIEWFANRYEEKVDEISNMIVDLGLDIWALSETSPKATEALVARINQKFGLQFDFRHSEPNAPSSKQTTAVVWNPRTVDGERVEWPAEVDRLFQLRSEDFQLGPEARPSPKPGKIFDRYPALFRFKARGGVAGGLDFNLVPLHLKAMAEGWERRRMASQILAHAVATMIRRHGADADWIIGGDVNEELASGDFDALLKDDFTALAAQDEAEGALSYIKSPRSLIDHVFLSPNMSRIYGPQDFFILAKEKSQVDYLKRFSDHRPVMLRLSARTGAPTPRPERGRIDQMLSAQISAMLSDA
ncbi:MAG: N-acetylmuramoyl-L-alanine amidase [Phenylobacterium sp.]|uniref:N-acetylmuramoyl-L-alanine amidase n=1 Tax=Phenylobacterium sp. TaxID=1871053 RepID=UPI002734120B|nr:N-acetylmuramoyl-L-alanine amidase [Phenylobacterium sp.]MDP3747197.1 N-acetylmuramoyl-L-alanine amidase [Phenylobacterium sp.]